MAISRAQTGKELKGGKGKGKVRTVMSEYKKGKLHSGSKKGPKGNVIRRRSPRKPASR
jgi:hypothetical protein